MGKDLGGAIIAMKAKDQRGNLYPSRREAMEEVAQGGELLLLSLGGAGVPAAVIVFITSPSSSPSSSLLRGPLSRTLL